METKNMPLEEVKEFVKLGQVKAGTLVYTEGAKRWRLAASIQEVRDLIREFDPTQDAALDRIRIEGVEGNTVKMKARRLARERSEKPLWKRLF